MNDFINGLKNLTSTLEEMVAKCERIAALQVEQRRINGLLETEIAEMRSQSKAVIRALEGETTADGPQDKNLKELLDPGSLPVKEPRQTYERIHALITAATPTGGLTFDELVAAYAKLRWKDFESEDLPQKLRDGIKTLRKHIKTKLSHSGGRGGKYMIT